MMTIIIIIIIMLTLQRQQHTCLLFCTSDANMDPGVV